MQVSGPFFNLKQAAEYCGYSPETFSRKIREYDIPRYGPEKNRFAKSTLDNFMASPDTFKKAPKQYKRKSPQQVKI